MPECTWHSPGLLLGCRLGHVEVMAQLVRVGTDLSVLGHGSEGRQKDEEHVLEYVQLIAVSAWPW